MALQYYVKREKCKVNDVIFPSVCEARAINLDNKNMKIDIYTGVTSVRSENIFTPISRYSTGKHEISNFLTSLLLLCFPVCIPNWCGERIFFPRYIFKKLICAICSRVWSNSMNPIIQWRMLVYVQFIYM